MGDTSRVVEAAKTIITAGKHQYGQVRGKGWLEDDVMDCSEFVYHAYRDAGFASFPAADTAGMGKTLSKVLGPVQTPQPGDIIYWDYGRGDGKGHVGIVEDPVKGTFLGSQTSTGPASASYKEGYWSTKGEIHFLRYE